MPSPNRLTFRPSGAIELVSGPEGERFMTTPQQNQRLSDIAVKPTFRVTDCVSIRFVESDPVVLASGVAERIALERADRALDDRTSTEPSVQLLGFVRRQAIRRVDPLRPVLPDGA